LLGGGWGLGGGGGLNPPPPERHWQCVSFSILSPTSYETEKHTTVLKVPRLLLIPSHINQLWSIDHLVHLIPQIFASFEAV